MNESLFLLDYFSTHGLVMGRLTKMVLDPHSSMPDLKAGAFCGQRGKEGIDRVV